jgi:hypothetical protein
MKTKLDGPHLLILAALGLELGCVGRVSGEDELGSGSESESGSDSDSSADTTSDENSSDESSGTSETGGDPYTCEDPQPILQAGTEIPSGFVQCADGFIHRVEAVECVTPQAADNPRCTDGFGCESAADCVDDSFGSCVVTDAFAGCGCHYGCATDADCDEGYVCACAGVAGDRSTCIPAGCATTDECGDGLCGLSDYEGCCGTNWSLACAGADAPCHVDADCTEAPCNPEYPRGEWAMFQCTSQNENGTAQPWTCQPPGWCGCDCGRPFFVDGRARTAEVVEREDWCDRIDPREVDLQTRRRLAACWAEIGQLEHASIASFARFGLQLIQLGAPAELLADAQRAMADEIRHARSAFGLASAYAGEAVGPGRLDVEGSLPRAASLEAIVEGLVIEACVGETLAAIEVREAAGHAEDPTIAAMLDEIATDELRHAQLGWRSLRWILDHASEDLRRFAWTTFEVALHALASDRSRSGLPASLRRHGVLDDALRDRVRRAGIESLIRPCVTALRRCFQGYAERSPSVSTS